MKMIKKKQKQNKTKKVGNNYELLVEGLNVEKLLNNFNDNKIKVYNLSRISYKKLSFIISKKDYKLAINKKLLSGFSIQKINEYGFAAFANHAKLKIGIYSGLLVIVIAFFILSQFTYKITVMGTEKINKNEIVSELKNMGVEVGKINKLSQDIEQNLKLKFNEISLVSVIKKGTSLIINIKEKISAENDLYVPIIAPNNLVITKMQVAQGIAQKRIGDVVLKGEVLVLPYTMNSNGQQVECEPIADIECDVWYGGKVEFNAEKKELVRTGNKIVNSYYEIMGAKFFETKKAVPFEKYEEVVYNEYVYNNLFLPLKLHKIEYYETKEKIKKQDFAQNKDKLEKQSKTKAYAALPKGLEVIEENTVTSVVGTNYTVQTFLKCHITL